jgi:hypothetical protein
MFSSLVTTVQTPAKCPGPRWAPSSTSESPSTRTVVAKPSGYISSGVGANSTSTPCASAIAASSASVRG